MNCKRCNRPLPVPQRGAELFRDFCDGCFTRDEQRAEVAELRAEAAIRRRECAERLDDAEAADARADAIEAKLTEGLAAP